MRRVDFDDRGVFELIGKQMLDVHPPEVSVYRHIATGECFQVMTMRPQYRRGALYSDKNQPYGRWLALDPD